MHELKKNILSFFCDLNFFFEKSCFFCLNLFVSIPKTSPLQTCVFSQKNLFFFFLICYHFCVFPLCLFSLSLLFQILFFSRVLFYIFFLFTCFLSLRLLSLCLCTLSYVSSVCYLFSFCENFFESSLFFFFFVVKDTFLHLFIFSEKTWCYLFFSSFFFLIFFFNRVLSKKINLTFFRKNTW